MALNVEEELSYKRKKRGRRILYRFFLLGGVALGVTVIGTWWVVARSGAFEVQEVTVSGNEDVSREEILNLLWRRVREDSFAHSLLGNANLLLWPSEVSSDDLKEMPLLKRMDIRKDYRERRVTVEVEERKPFGILCAVSGANPDETQNDAEEKNISERECWWFDEEGVIFKPALAVEGSLIPAFHDYSLRTFGTHEKILPEEFIDPLFSIFETLASLRMGIREVRLVNLDREEVAVLTYEGPKLLFSLRFAAPHAGAVIESLRGGAGFEKVDYIDFRVENRAYYR